MSVKCWTICRVVTPAVLDRCLPWRLRSLRGRRIAVEITRKKIARLQNEPDTSLTNRDRDFREGLCHAG